jgi:hypothetical protein
MNTSLYLPDALAQRLDDYLKSIPSETSKNKIIAWLLKNF